MAIDDPHWRSEIRYVVGVGLGQTSSVCIIEAFAERESPITPAKSFFHVRHLQRYPTEMAYPELIEDVRMILERIRTGSELVIDETSVGRQVSDLFRAIARPIRVNISNTGTEATQTGQPHTVCRFHLCSR